MCLITGSADYMSKIYNVYSGKLLKTYNDNDIVVMHGMRVFEYLKNDNMKYFIVSGSKIDDIN